MAPKVGRLVIIGGAEDKERECTILREVVDLCGGPAARLLVLTAAALYPRQVGEEYRRVLLRLGAGEVAVADISHRSQAEAPLGLRLVESASGIFFTGGDQLRITSLLGGTALFRALTWRFQQGALVAGTSAGASVMSSTMIIDGENDQGPTMGTVSLAAGFGLIKNAVIDQHFAERGRMGRLLAAIAQNPDVLGIGIDENTAIVVEGQGFRVLGAGTVSVLDARHIRFTNVSEVSPQAALALGDVRLHVLPQGYVFDLGQREALYNPAVPGEH